MKLGALKDLIAEAEKHCTGDADECEISIVDSNDNEYEIGAVDMAGVDEEDEQLYIFVEQTEDEKDDED